ncbi:metal-dependent hydrolase [Haloterrigena turkmenica]|uniref:metal-dependent hydrolase n=1 Tax=Haloterrigena turkmenica TaxID=62320 RepID=UPI000AB9B236|nr:metal-dependent hydrolase [Haloterrigena turkmenica]
MPDALTHVLIAYALATALSLRYEWITPRLTTVAMAGAMIPDLAKLGRVISPETVEAVLGVPFSWQPIHTVGGGTLAILVASLVVRPAYRRPVALSLTLGIGSHFVLDMFLIPPAGTFPYLWPLTDAEIALPGLYKSGDGWIVPIGIAVALGVQSVVRRRSLEAESAVRTDG